MSFTTECMTFCDKSVLSSVAGRIQLHWSILVAASLGCALLDAHWAKINFKILSSMSLWDWSKITTNHILSMYVRDYFIIYYYCFRGILLDLLFVIFFWNIFWTKSEPEFKLLAEGGRRGKRLFCSSTVIYEIAHCTQTPCQGRVSPLSSRISPPLAELNTRRRGHL